MKTITLISSKNLVVPTLCLLFAAGLACDKAQAFLVLEDEYVARGTLTMDPGFNVDPDYTYLAMYFDFDNQTGVTVARTDCCGTPSTSFSTSVTVPSGADILGYGLLGIYPSGGQVYVSASDTTGMIGTEWGDFYTTFDEPTVLQAMSDYDTQVLEAFASDNRERIIAEMEANAHLVGFSAGQEIGGTVIDDLTLVPEPASVPLLASLGLLPTLLRRRRKCG
jgi:hypothetical protein